MRWALIDFHHPFFRPLIRRIVVFCVVAIWTVVEYFGGSLGWTIFFLALTAYVGWGFFLSGQVQAPLPGTETADKAPQSGDES
ncbi:MAG: hypothetical protein ABJN75_22820 [Hoeflea sp.]|uniref:hypothetical protein n=1 Tax=Hoeflea sp. TaxID=1940281 RepID=UPI003296E61B|tara:strand:- start:14797 stop:15045 length:249 start_codon:yes stop_codon:yes gene_type:complete